MNYDLKTFERMDVFSLLVLLVNRLGIKETMAKQNIEKLIQEWSKNIAQV
jgi:hypothetical protein